MSATATLPLPLELTKPVELSSSLEDAIREAFEVANTKYNDQTQLRETSEGVPQCWGGGTSSNANCHSQVEGIIAIDSDVQIDDNDVL